MCVCVCVCVGVCGCVGVGVCVHQFLTLFTIGPHHSLPTSSKVVHCWLESTYVKSNSVYLYSDYQQHLPSKTEPMS